MLSAASLVRIVKAETQGLAAYAREVVHFGPLTAYNSGAGLPTDGAMLDPIQPLSQADAAQLLTFFAERNITPKVQTLGHVLPENLTVLARAGLVFDYALHLYTCTLPHDLHAEAAITTEQALDRQHWAAVAAQAFGGGSVMMQANVARGDLECWWALQQGQPVGVGALTVDAGGVASLFSAATLSAARSQGVQRALLLARLRAAQQRGATLATVFVVPGSGSERNVVRAGFQLGGVRLQFGPIYS